MEVMLRDLSGDPDVGGSTVHFRDVTDRVEEFGASYFAGLDAMGGSSGGIANVTPEGRLVRFNDRFEAIVGHSRDDLLEVRSVSDLLHPEDRDAHRAELVRVAQGGTTSVAEWRHLRSDGSIAWVTARVQRPLRSGGASDLLVVTVEDVGARKDAEQALGLLTPREREVLGMICQGLDNSAIAQAMFVSVHTVKHHVQGVLRKLEVPDRRRAAERVAALDASSTAWTGA
jgi:PAS domain S-box-containing protein